MQGTPRERAREQTMADIIAIGREHLAAHGAAALSLRAVARDLGVVSSAVYRYVKNRDELLTLLVIDGYTELGDAVDKAVGKIPEERFGQQFTALCQAVRHWALRTPSRYALLFGSPVPGYQAPGDLTTEPGTRVIVTLLSIIDRAYQAGQLNPNSPNAAGPIPDLLAADFDSIKTDQGIQWPDALVAQTMLAWTSLFGMVSFEVFGQYGRDTLAHPDQLFELQVGTLSRIAGLS